MRYAEFYSAGFTPRDDKQISLFKEFQKLRSIFGTPPQIAYLRSLARTRPHTRTVYPPGWRFE